MASGIEVAGLALALLPLFVNQIDAYVRGIEKIKLLRRYKREFKGYSVGLRTQSIFLLNTLEKALEGVVHDEDRVSQLICNPESDDWMDADLQQRMRQKLGRNYDVFVDNMTGLSELLHQLKRKLGIDEDNERTPTTDAWDIWKFRKILSRAIYDDLLGKIERANAILGTLIDQSSERERTKTKRQPWNYLLKRYQKARRHAEGLFKTIVGGGYWNCQCQEQHCVHFQLQTNPLQGVHEHNYRNINTDSQFRVIFSNTNDKNNTCLWTWTEVVFEPWREQDMVTVMSSLSLDSDFHSPLLRKPKVQFDFTLPEEKMPASKCQEVPWTPTIQDFCSSLRVAKSHVGRQESIGSIPSEIDASVKYTMHAVKVLPKRVPQMSLREVLSSISRRDRLHIAAGLACGMIQYCGNWLKSWWDSSDVHLSATSDGRNVLLDNLYLTWPLTAKYAPEDTRNEVNDSDVEGNRLLPLGLALVELSLGKSLHALPDPEDEKQDTMISQFRTTSRIITMVHKASGSNYAEAVRSCLTWSTLCLESQFEERVFNTIVSPLLKDLVNFEGLSN